MDEPLYLKIPFLQKNIAHQQADQQGREHRGPRASGLPKKEQDDRQRNPQCAAVAQGGEYGPDCVGHTAAPMLEKLQQDFIIKRMDNIPENFHSGTPLSGICGGGANTWVLPSPDAGFLKIVFAIPVTIPDKALLSKIYQNVANGTKKNLKKHLTKPQGRE